MRKGGVEISTPISVYGGIFMGKNFKHLERNDRIKMETLLNAGHKVTEVADYLGVHRSTIYREMKRGKI
jgi:IS30 family transposase